MSGIHKAELSAAFFPKESGNKWLSLTLVHTNEVHVSARRRAGMTTNLM